jgi:predicted aconitase
MINSQNLNIKLTPEEEDILSGGQGLAMAKVMQTVVLYAEALRAERLAEIEGPGHFVIPWASPGIAPPIEMLEELVAAGLQTKFPFTLDPRPPFDFENLSLSLEIEEATKEMYKDQTRYDELMVQLGLRDENAYTCNPYQPEVGNIPKPGTVLAWSESACAVYANSVIAARTNRNGAIMDLLSNIAGKTPYTGLITDRGRKANWLVEVAMEDLPNPHLLGAAIGEHVQTGVPYIIGLDRFLGVGINAENIDYLQEMGAILATYSAVDLYHVENITPEAVKQNRELLLPIHSNYTISDDALLNQSSSYPILWSDSEVVPEKCYIGCPHLSLRQLNWWSENIHSALQKRNRAKISVKTTICAAPQVLMKFKSEDESYSRLVDSGVKLSPTCSETIFETGLCTGKPIITNSNKLRAYTTARFFADEELVEIIVRGEISGEDRDE